MAAASAMNARRVVVEVRRDGSVRAVRRWDNSHSAEGLVAWAGLDADLITMFEGWLAQRDRRWDICEIQNFGRLLHRCLMPPTIWSWVEDTIAVSPQPVLIELVFPDQLPYSRLAAIPWEFLYRPASKVRSGGFLATDPRIVLCRHIRTEAGESRLRWTGGPHLLVVVSQPKDGRLGEVMYEDVVTAVQSWADEHGVRVSVMHNPTTEVLRTAISPRHGDGPDLIHFLGHGEFDPDRGRASLALCDATGRADWVSDQDIAELFGRGRRPPRLVVLHCCEGGRSDFTSNFAGVAAQLARSGVAAVVAMQYAVTNETAIDFSLELYRQLGQGLEIGDAVQEARWRISGLQADRDPRLVGLPVLYLQNPSALEDIGARGAFHERL